MSLYGGVKWSVKCNFILYKSFNRIGMLVRASGGLFSTPRGKYFN